MPNDDALFGRRWRSHQRYFNAAVDAVLRATQYAIEHNLGDVLSQRYGYGESCVSPSLRRRMHHIYQIALSRRITILAASGDQGALSEPCALAAYRFGAAVDMPAFDPLVTSGGGTVLRLSYPDGIYRSETAWNQLAPSTTGRMSTYHVTAAATGGGLRDAFSRPPYQDRIRGVGRFRAAPDVAFLASGVGVDAVLRIPLRTGVWRVSGTSIGAPAWAGIVALADQYANRRLWPRASP